MCVAVLALKWERPSRGDVGALLWLKVRTWSLCDRGLSFDRHWMVVGENGACVTQKRQPRLCLIRPSVHPDRGTLLMSCAGKRKRKSTDCHPTACFIVL